MNNQLARIIIIIALVFLGLSIYSKFAPGLPVSSVVTTKQSLFSVSGEGKVTVVPDMAIVDVGITSNNPTVKAAQTQANDTINKITEAIKALGVESKDVKTSNYSVYPQYDYSPPGNRITGYSVTASLTVTVRDLEKVNQVIDAATTNGANVVGGVQLTVDDSRHKELLKEAREIAITEAKEKAQSLASAAGMTLGKIVDIQETGASPVPPTLYNKDVALEAEGRGGATNIQPGSTDIITSITLFYETR